MLEDAKTLKDYNIGKINITSSKAKLEQAAPVYFHCSLSDYTPETPSLKNVTYIHIYITTVKMIYANYICIYMCVCRINRK